MKHTDVLITGFVKSPALALQSLKPLTELQREGVIRDIHYVTWDSPELDPWLAPVAAVPGVQLTCVPQPDAKGTPAQRGVVYQVENLKAALAQLADEDGLVFKTRLDFVADTDFLRRKITGFETHCAPVSRTAPNGVVMPAPLLENRIWIPWADSNHPFFYEDAAFLGTCRDIQKLVTPLDAADFAVLGLPQRGGYAHVVRFAKIFTGAYPLFVNYLRHYRYYVNDLAYRQRLVSFLLDDGFFWHVLVAHAWILHSHFHVDIGRPGELRFYANNVNQNADWSRPQTLRLANPYDQIANWRDGTRPGEATHTLRHAYGRLMDDAWPTALFTRPLPDLPAQMLRGLMENVAAHRDGRLAELERDFYRGLERFHLAAWQQAKAG